MNQQSVSISLKGDKVFVETFLISANDLNSKGWKVSHDDPTDFDNRVLASKNHPLTLYQTEYNGKEIWDHPHAPRLEGETASNQIQNDIEFQKKYTIGYATHFKKVKDGIWNATYEIVNEAAKKFFTSIKDKGLQLFTSPYIARLNNEDRTNLKTWALVHNAIVTNPANRRELAEIKEICQGSESSCSSLFASDNSQDCGYCMEQSLRDYVTSHSQKEPPKQNIMSETASTQAQQVAASVVETNTPVIPTTKQESTNVVNTINPIAPQPQVTENNKSNVDTTSKDSQISELKAQIESMNKQMALEKRTSSVKEILKDIAPVVYLDTNTGGIDEQRFNADLDGLVNRNLSIEDIQELAHARFIIAKSRSGSGSSVPKVAGLAASDNSNEFTSQVAGNTKSISYTKMVTGESASNNTGNPSLDLENAVLSRVLSQNLAINSKVLSNAKRFGSGGFGY